MKVSLEMHDTDGLLELLRDKLDPGLERDNDDDCWEIIREIRRRGEIYDAIHNLMVMLVADVEVEISILASSK